MTNLQGCVWGAENNLTKQAPLGYGEPNNQHFSSQIKLVLNQLRYKTKEYGSLKTKI